MLMDKHKSLQNRSLNSAYANSKRVNILDKFSRNELANSELAKQKGYLNMSQYNDTGNLNPIKFSDNTSNYNRSSIMNSKRP